MSTSIAKLDRSFRVKVVGFDHIYYPTSKDFLKFATLDEHMIANSELFAEFSLTFGGENLCASRKTKTSVPLCCSPRWNEWMQFDIALCNLPVGAKLYVTLWAKSETKLLQLAWANMPLMDRQHHLRQGIFSHRMFQDDSPHLFGSCSENFTNPKAPILFVEFDTYPVLLRFPTAQEQLDFCIELEKMKTARNMEPESLTEVERMTIEKIIKKHSLEKLEENEKQLLWKGRHDIMKTFPSALPKFLRSIRWSNREAVAEGYVLLKQWNRPAPLDALELLSVKFSDPEVRRFAIECLEGLSDAYLIDLLPQLVQVLKSELHLDSHLSRFLLARGLRNPMKVGHGLFWLLRAEMYVAETSQRFGLLLEEFLNGCSIEYISRLYTEFEVLDKLFKVAIEVPNVEKDKRNEFSREKLQDLVVPKHFGLPLGSQWAASGLIVDQCRAMDSKKVPLWLTFTNADAKGPPLIAMLKYGDDLRQDIVTLQMIRIMDKLWEAEGLQLRLNTYTVVATGDNMGMLEIVPNAVTYAKITKEAGGAMEVFNKQRVKDWIAKENRGGLASAAITNFIRSAAGYCVATYVLGIGDRHDDNIMFTHQGHLFHIDFGHFLGHFKDFKKIPGVKIRRERTPFVFTPDWAVAIGGLHSDGFNSFVDLCCKAYLVLRKNANLFINMFAMMLSTGIPELEDEEDIQYMIDVLKLDVSDDEATSQLKKLILYSHNNFFKQVDGYFHIATRK
eukprot:c21646_g3_i3.p1 GENE.c21646_g3_i3~~c21646_g3_i3.p1  ORF type:complete len:760 (-),score=319.23 c21646_g3_i3:167-2356(-)